MVLEGRDERVEVEGWSQCARASGLVARGWKRSGTWVGWRVRLACEAGPAKQLCECSVAYRCHWVCTMRL